MKQRLEIVSALNTRMIENFKHINKLMLLLDRDSDKYKESHQESFKSCMNNIYSILLEYFFQVMNLTDTTITSEWLNSHISNDNSYILADKAKDNEVVVVDIYERDSYIQKEYVEVLLELQELIQANANFDELFRLYNEHGSNIIGCATMLLYHTEDLKDLIIIENSKCEKSISLKEFLKRT